jgi:hypothetical protein
MKYLEGKGLIYPDAPTGQAAPEYPLGYMQQFRDASGGHRVITYPINSECCLQDLNYCNRPWSVCQLSKDGTSKKPHVPKMQDMRPISTIFTIACSQKLVIPAQHFFKRSPWNEHGA